MADRLEELFNAESSALKPRTAWPVGLIIAAGLVAVPGLLFTVVPSAVLLIVAWVMVDQEVQRIEAGALPEEVRPRLEMLNNIVFFSLLATIVLLVGQFVLVCLGVYKELWEMMLVFIYSATGTGPGA